MKFYEYETPSGLTFRHLDVYGDFLIVESAKLSQTIVHIRENGPVQLELNPQRGFTLKSFDFLAGVEHLVEGLAIVEDKLDLSGIESFINLRHLQFANKLEQQVRFEVFHALAFCALDWHKIYSRAIFPPSILELNIWSYTSRFGFNEASLQNLRNVTEIKLVQASIEDLSLLDYCGALTRADIAYSSRTLTDISALTRHAASLTRLDLDMCKKIADFAPLARLTNLEWLNVCDCKSIPSLSFLQNLPNLKHFVFRGTTVEDGDLSYLKGIDYVIFNNKPHYSLKQEDFPTRQ